MNKLARYLVYGFGIWLEMLPLLALSLYIFPGRSIETIIGSALVMFVTLNLQNLGRSIQSVYKPNKPAKEPTLHGTNHVYIQR